MIHNSPPNTAQVHITLIICCPLFQYLCLTPFQHAPLPYINIISYNLQHPSQSLVPHVIYFLLSVFLLTLDSPWSNKGVSFMLQDCNFPRFSQKVCQQLRTRWKEIEEGIDLRYNICILFTFQYISALFLSFYSGLLISLCICIIFIQFTTVHAIRVSDQFLNFYDNTKAYMRARGIYGAVRGLF